HLAPRPHQRATRHCLALTAGAALLTATQAGAAPAPKPVTPAAWCLQKGGTPADYRAYYDNQLNLTPLGTVRELCRFQNAKDNTQIILPSDTLAADKPTLAALAYIRKPALPPVPGGANPAAVYCAHLGGTSQFGEGKLDVGGWIREGDRVSRDNLHSMCMFADGSAIDEWGLTYHTFGVVRGANLENKFRAHIPSAQGREAWNRV
ncbi:hypothetical protein, partial [Streptomyces sp. NRRL B-1677]|uniref:hypothetical protein n=1 Tax=Streptomyces sp. NRRL B-1677 TaxID=2682966 RepID=UPI002B4B7791